MARRIDLKKIVAGRINAGGELRAALVSSIRARWVKEARANLGTSSNTVGQYVAGLIPHEGGVDLIGVLPVMFERGMGPGGIGTEGSYDIRKFVLKEGTSNLKRGKNGMYVNIPFSHTAGAILAAGGKGAQKAAKALKPYRTGGYNRAKGQSPSEYRLGDNFGARLKGLVRQEDTYSKGAAGVVKQSKYTTWRTMSEGGNPWIHPGIRARRIANKVLAAMPQMIAKVLKAAL